MRKGVKILKPYFKLFFIITTFLNFKIVLL